MKSIQVLGISKDFICVISETLSDAGIADHMDIFYNIPLDFGPNIVTKEFSYSIMPFGVLPDTAKPVVLGVSMPYNKSTVFDYFLKTPGMIKERYINVIHPKAYISPSSILDHGLLVEPGVVISAQSRIGFGVAIKRGSLIGHHNTIGDFVDISPGVVLSGSVNIGRGCMIGSGTVVTGCLLELTKFQGPWLNHGDVVELEIERIGILRNTVQGN